MIVNNETFKSDKDRITWMMRHLERTINEYKNIWAKHEQPDATARARHETALQALTTLHDTYMEVLKTGFIPVYMIEDKRYKERITHGEGK